VRIVKVVRDPGHRSKIAVTTSDERVDPVGACVGMRGNRVQAIVRELSNERIDIINWTTELSLLVRRVFSPAEVKRVHEVGENKVVVIIREDDLAQAIGKEGQNIRLAARLLDKEIDVYGDDEFNALTEEDKAKALSPAPAEEAPSGAEAKPEGGAELDVEGETDEEGAAAETGEDPAAGDDVIQDVIAREAIVDISDTDTDAADAIEKTEKKSGEEEEPPAAE
jgi:N utilization substance protein A